MNVYLLNVNRMHRNGCLCSEWKLEPGNPGNLYPVFQFFQRKNTRKKDPGNRRQVARVARDCKVRIYRKETEGICWKYRPFLIRLQGKVEISLESCIFDIKKVDGAIP